MNRQAKTKGKPFSIRLSEDEKNLLQTKATGVPLGVFIRSLILNEDVKTRTSRRQYPIKDAEVLGQVLGLLGKSRLANNLNQLAKAANLGALPVTEELETELRAACADIADMRRLLLHALGVARDEIKSHERSLTASFAQSAGRPS